MCAAPSFSSLGFHFWISLPALVVDMGTLGRAEADFEAGSDVVTLAEEWRCSTYTASPIYRLWIRRILNFHCPSIRFEGQHGEEFIGLQHCHLEQRCRRCDSRTHKGHQHVPPIHICDDWFSELPLKLRAIKSELWTKTNKGRKVSLKANKILLETAGF